MFLSYSKAFVWPCWFIQMTIFTHSSCGFPPTKKVHPAAPREIHGDVEGGLWRHGAQRLQRLGYPVAAARVFFIMLHLKSEETNQHLKNENQNLILSATLFAIRFSFSDIRRIEKSSGISLSNVAMFLVFWVRQRWGDRTSSNFSTVKMAWMACGSRRGWPYQKNVKLRSHRHKKWQRPVQYWNQIKKLNHVKPKLVKPEVGFHLFCKEFPTAGSELGHHDLWPQVLREQLSAQIPHPGLWRRSLDTDPIP